MVFPIMIQAFYYIKSALFRTLLSNDTANLYALHFPTEMQFRQYILSAGSEVLTVTVIREFYLLGYNAV
jgi:hypothetical protein